MARLVLSDLEDLRRRIAPHVKHAWKVIAFGSVARGQADPGSDLDLIIVADTARRFFERFKDFAGLYTVWPRLDLLIYTREEFARMLAEDNPLIRQALEEGVVLHEAPEGSSRAVARPGGE